MRALIVLLFLASCAPSAPAPIALDEPSAEPSAEYVSAPDTPACGDGYYTVPIFDVADRSGPFTCEPSARAPAAAP